MKLKCLLYESVWDTSAKAISKLVFDFVKETSDTYDKSDPYDDTVEIFSDETIKCPISITVNRDKSTFKGDVYVDGGVTQNKNTNKIEIDVYINPKKEPNIYSKLYALLYDVVRHELQHLLQSGKNKQPDRARPTSGKERKIADAGGRYSYTMLPDELEALVFGFLLSAKLRRVPITKIFTDQLDEWLKNGEIDSNEYKLIYNAWVDFTKKHISSAKLK